MVVFGQIWLYLGKSGCIGAKVVEFGQDCCIRAKVVVFEQKWLNWGISGGIRAKVVVISQSGSIQANVVVFGQKWQYSDKMVVFGQK